MKKALSLILALVLTVSCLTGITFAAEPNYLFEVTNGGVATKVETVAEMRALIAEDGLTKVKLLRDHYISAKGSIVIPYSCEIDLNGFTIKTWDGNPLEIEAVGSENTTTVVKNGTLIAEDYRMAGMTAIRYYDGSLQMENVIAYAPNGMAVASYVTDPQYNDDNLITGCVLVSGNYFQKSGDGKPAARGWCGFGFNKTGGAQTGIAAKIENTVILAVRPGGTDAFAYRTAGNTVTLGYNVDVYTYYTRVADKGLTLSGQALTKAEGTFSVFVPSGIPARTSESPDKNVSYYTKLTRYSTPSGAISAEVDGTAVTSVEAMLAAIKEDGTSEVKLLSDIYANAALNIPYSCTIDLNEHTVQVSLTNALDIKAAGDTEKTTTIKNGTVIGGISALCWRAGGLVVDNVDMVGKGSAAVQILNHAEADANAADYADVNVIKNSTLWSTAWYAISFNSSKKDFTASSIKIENSKLMAKTNNRVLGNQGGTTKPGTYVLGEDVYMYTTNASQYAVTSDPKATITGEEVIKAPSTYTVDCAGMSWAGRNLFTTAKPAEVTFESVASENGTFTLPEGTFKNGEEVTVTATPDEGFQFSYLLVNDVRVNSLTFVVPYTETVTVQVVFEAKIPLTVTPGEGGTISLPNEVFVGQTYTAEVTPESSDWRFVGLKVNGGDTVESASFVVPAGDSVTVQGVFEAKRPLTLLASTGGSSSMTLTKAFVGDKVTVSVLAVDSAHKFTHLLVNGERVDSNTFTVPEGTGNVDVQAIFGAKATLSVIPNADGSLSIPNNKAYAGEKVTVTVKAIEGMYFSHLLVNGQRVDSTTFEVPAAETVTVQAVFSETYVPPVGTEVLRPTNHTITIETVAGGTVKASAEKATINTVIDLEIIPEAGYVLESITVKKLYNGKNATVTDNSFYMPYSNVVITPVFKQAG